jgi:hypothetical protein
MNFASLKRSFLAAFPVVGPHAGVESELLLAGKKPLGWTLVAPDDTQFKDPRMQKDHQGRMLLDRAVASGNLIAIDVEQRNKHAPAEESVIVLRHYAQLGQEQNLRRVSEFNKRAFNGLNISDADLDQDMGHYLGYRRRDIFLFNHVAQSGLLPGCIKRIILYFNAACQKARREALLIESGHDLQAWYDSLPREKCDL